MNESHETPKATKELKPDQVVYGLRKTLEKSTLRNKQLEDAADKLREERDAANAKVADLKAQLKRLKF